MGLTFKPNTDDIREAPALSIIAALQDRGAIIRAYDPQGMRSRPSFSTLSPIARILMIAPQAPTRLLIVTEWEQFRALDLPRLKTLMKGPVLIDLRNIYRHDEAAHAGFEYHAVGRP